MPLADMVTPAWMPTYFRIIGVFFCTAGDQRRLVPAQPLRPGARYRLALDTRREAAFQAEPAELSAAGIDAVETHAGGRVELRFRTPVNPLTVRSGVNLRGQDGKRVHFRCRRARLELRFC